MQMYNLFIYVVLLSLQKGVICGEFLPLKSVFYNNFNCCDFLSAAVPATCGFEVV